MELYQLETFIAIVRHGNFSRAARFLRLAQPALSSQMKKLEEELETKLIIRDRPRIRLTPAGELLRQRATMILDMARQTRKAISDVNELKRGRLTLSAIPSLIGCWLPPVIEKFRAKYPDIELILLEDSSSGVAESVNSGIADLGFLQLPTDNRKFDVHGLIREPFQLLVRKDTVKGKAAVRLADFRDYPFIFYKGRAREVALDACRRAGFEPKVACASGELDTIRALVNARLGIALLPNLAFTAALPAGLKGLDVSSPKVSRVLGWINAKNRILNPAATAFAKEIHEHLIIQCFGYIPDVQV
jgi:LysR family transcriptional regulator, hydrogen peroxide-inducible genes activator